MNRPQASRPAHREAEMRRLLRFVLKAAGRAVREAVGDGAILLRDGARAYRFGVDTVTGAQREGWIELDGSAVRATREGQSALVRMLHPEEGFRLQHVVSDAQARAAAIDPTHLRHNHCESPLARLYLRNGAGRGRFLAQEEYAAGERLRSDFEKGQLQPRISLRLDGATARRGHPNLQSELSDFAIDARRRVQAAMSALAPDLRGVALDICCFLKGLEQVERERRLPARSAKLLLRAALSTLADHYGFSSHARRRAGVLHWGAADYRPTISPCE